jgi:hypothetical protein
MLDWINIFKKYTYAMILHKVKKYFVGSKITATAEIFFHLQIIYFLCRMKTSLVAAFLLLWQ